MNQASFWKQLKFVTGNPNKVREAESILGVEFDHETMELEEIQTPDVETAVRHKVMEAYSRLQCPVLVEDSGLVFQAWNGLPGALVKWFEKTVGLPGMLRMLDGFEDRAATAQCVVGLHDGNQVITALGQVEGIIAETERGQGGFGWDPIFIPDGHDRTFGEMSAGEKNSISHRRRAFERLRGLVGTGSG